VAVEDQVIVAVAVRHPVPDAVEVERDRLRQICEEARIGFGEPPGVVVAPVERAVRKLPQIAFAPRLRDVAVVVALDADHVVRAHPVQHLTRPGSVVHQVARAVDRVRVLLARPDGLERDDVAVDIREDERFHGAGGYQRRRKSARARMASRLKSRSRSLHRARAPAVE
jgi:hypothetical protein